MDNNLQIQIYKEKINKFINQYYVSWISVL